MRTATGHELVVAVDIWNDLVSLRDDEGIRRTITLDELKLEVGQPLGPRNEPRKNAP